jgi:hypothetical protein
MEPLEERRMLATITVNSLLDNGDGANTTLREAVALAAPNDTIVFSVTGTIQLTSTGSGHITISKPLTIQGPGASQLTIRAHDPDGGGTNDSDGHRVFTVDDAGSISVVNISGLTLTNGDPDIENDESAAVGGAIRNSENLTLSNCVLTGNYSSHGGAIYNTGTLTINDSTISGNAAEDGAGVFNEDGNVTANRSLFQGNAASNSGGGIFNRLGDLTIVDSTISGNTADIDAESGSGSGGGIASYESGSTINVLSSTISGNGAQLYGGGVYQSDGTLTITDSTISGNSANDRGAGIFARYMSNDDLKVNHSTITANTTPGSGNSGAGIRSSARAVLNHTIVAGNLLGASTDDLSGTFALNFSLIGDGAGFTIASNTSSLLNASANLGPLADNGGRTRTHTLLAGSQAIDAGNPAAVAGAGGVPMLDQRGVARIQDGNGAAPTVIDIGAYERAPVTSYVVDIAADEHDFNYAAGDLSLREAVILANGNAGTADTISFHASLSGQTINLTLGHMPITDAVTVTGLGENSLTVNASANIGNRIFTIDPSGIVAGMAVVMSGLKLTGANIVGHDGGAIQLFDDNLTLNNMIITANTATTGGGIAIMDTGSLQLSNSTLSLNNATSAGGGIRNGQGNLTITDCTFSGNTAANGGAIWNDTNLTTQTTTIVGSTISGNSATTAGGGLSNSDGLVVIRHSTITNNTAPAGAGSGLASAGNATTRTEVASTIISGNANSSVDLIDGATNSLQSNGYNLVGNSSAADAEFIETGDILNSTPMLEALANNGGPTQTHLLAAGSPAINAGNPGATPGSGGVPNFDQRGAGFNRVLAGRIDIGAIELAAPLLPELKGDYNLNEIVDAADYVFWRKLFGTTVVQYQRADGNGDTMIDDADYAVWMEAFGKTLPPGAGGGGEAMAARSNDDPAVEAATWMDDESASSAAGVVHELPATAANGMRLSDLLLALDGPLEAEDGEPISAMSIESAVADPSSSDALDEYFDRIGDSSTFALIRL